METIADLIEKKQAGKALTPVELRELVLGYHRGEVPDYQMAAFLMAVYFRGMTPEETSCLLDTMIASGERLAWSGLNGPVVDKHSTGGVGDKISLMLAPLLVADGCYVPMISGRGLGHTGGTLDKLDSIPGFQTRISLDEIKRLLPKIGCVLAGQTAELAPADRKMYALRDVTSTVRAIPLIAASILSKKLAEGLDGLVIDLKVGRGAFSSTMEFAISLAEALYENATRANIATRIVLTMMDVPIGRTIGNWLETREAIEWLHGKNDVRELNELTFTLGAELLDAVGKGPFDVAYKRLESHWKAGKGVENFARIVSAQGGDAEVVLHPEKMPNAAHVKIVSAPRDGYLQSADSLWFGKAGVILGAGRRLVTDNVDPFAGFRFLKSWGDSVCTGEPLIEVHGSNSSAVDEVVNEADKYVVIEEYQYRPVGWVLHRYQPETESKNKSSPKPSRVHRDK